VLEVLRQQAPNVTSNQDPTLNVKELNAASIAALSKEMRHGLKAVDEKSEMRADIAGLNAKHNKELLDRESAHNKELRLAETARIDAIRLVDTGNVTRAAEVSSAQASALAASVIQAAEALRISTESNRVTTATALETALAPVRTTLESLRQTQFQQQGEKSARTEGTGEDRFAQVYAQSQQQFLETMRQSRDDAVLREERAAKAAAIQQEQFLETIKLTRATTSNSNAGVRIAAWVGGASTLIALFTLIVLIAAHIL
jgi:hypothetical protein